jgi:hypothetical protein
MEKYPRAADETSESEDEGELAPNTMSRQMPDEDVTQFFFVESIIAIEEAKAQKEEEAADVAMVQKIKTK